MGLGLVKRPGGLTWRASPQTPSPCGRPQRQRAGFVAGAVKFASTLTDFVGKLFRRLRFIAVPIVLFSLIVAVASLGDPRKRAHRRKDDRPLPLRVFMFHPGVTLGARPINPGGAISAADRANLPRAAAGPSRGGPRGRRREDYSGWKIVLDAVPENPFAIANGQMLQIVVLSIVIGLGLTLIPTERNPNR